MNSKQQRDRGRILTSGGLNRLQQAIQAWELEHDVRCTQEKLRELTVVSKPPNGLDPGTIRKILKAKEGVDPESIRCLFTTFGLHLDETDLVSSSRIQNQFDPNFVGREGAIGDLNALINRGSRVIVIQARGGVGKTTLARKYLQQEFGAYLEFPIAKETKDIASIESLIEEKLRQLGEEPGREFFVSLDRLKRKLQTKRIGILIDNLEPALDAAGKFIEPHRRYVELLRVLADPLVESITLITTRERLRESSITVEHYILRSLDIAAWQQFFQSRNLSTETSAFAALHNAYGGNAKAMDLVRGSILEDYSGDIAAYWQANQNDLFIERDLEDLVAQQFDRLQQIDSDAYTLLCRMGCYRYQDVPTIPIEGLLCLLWDIPEHRQRRVVKSLQDRSLVEFENGEYWLHPVIRAEAISHLRSSEDSRTSNQKAAEFWTNSIQVISTVEDALQALEAYYHCIENEDFEIAAKTILRERENTFSWNISLGRTFYELGLFQQIIAAISLIVSQLETRQYLSRLYNLLGIPSRIVGNIHQAIDYHNLARQIAVDQLRLIEQSESEISPYAVYSEAESLMNIGICKAALWELQEAFDIFENISNKVESNLQEFIFCFTAYLSSSLGLFDRTIQLLTSLKAESLSCYGLNFLGKTYKNLNKIDEAFVIYQAIFDRQNDKNQSQVYALSMSGLAEIFREKKEFSNAIKYHFKSIQILEKIGAKTDLIEAYVQLGITRQVMNNLSESSIAFERALQLSREIEAPKQIERVHQLMMNK